MDGIYVMNCGLGGMKSYGPKQEKIGIGRYRVVNRIMIILGWNLIIVDLNDFGLEPKSLRIFLELRISLSGLR